MLDSVVAEEVLVKKICFFTKLRLLVALFAIDEVARQRRGHPLPPSFLTLSAAQQQA